MAQRDPRAAEAQRLRALAAGEQRALAGGGVVLGGGQSGLPTEQELLKLAAAQMGDQQEQIGNLQAMGATMAGIVSALAELIVGAFPTFERRPDGSFDLLVSPERLHQVHGYALTYEAQEDGGIKLTFVPPEVPTPPDEPTALAVVEDPPAG